MHMLACRTIQWSSHTLLFFVCVAFGAGGDDEQASNQQHNSVDNQQEPPAAHYPHPRELLLWEYDLRSAFASTLPPQPWAGEVWDPTGHAPDAQEYMHSIAQRQEVS